jgi:hypothetical protein
MNIITGKSENSKNKIAYTKEDLMWETLRRNENYKTFYEQEVKEKSSKDNVPKQQRENHFLIDPRFKLLKLFDPSIDILEIKKNINEGYDPRNVHPYNHLTKKQQPIIQHRIPNAKSMTFIPSKYDFDKAGDNNDLVSIQRSILQDRLVLSIDVLAKEKDIIKGVQRIRDAALKMHRNNVMEDDADNKIFRGETSVGFICYPRDIKKYIDWLKKYDEVIFYCRNEKMPMDIENGALIVSRNQFSFKCMLPDDHDKTKTENLAKKWREAYYKAVKLIQAAPNIPFSPLRTPKK